MFPDPRKMEKLQAIMEGDYMTLLKELRIHKKVEVMIEPVKHRGKERLGIFLNLVEEPEDEEQKSEQG